MTDSRVAIVSSELNIQRSLEHLLGACNWPVISASTICEAEIILKDIRVSVVVCAEELHDGDFREIVRLCRSEARKVPAVVFSPLADWERYLRIVRAGAFDYMRYPGAPGELERVVRNALSCGTRERNMRAASA